MPAGCSRACDVQGLTITAIPERQRVADALNLLLLGRWTERLLVLADRCMQMEKCPKSHQMSLFPGIPSRTALTPTRLLRADSLFRFLTLLLLRCIASLTPHRCGRCLRRTVGNAAAVTPTVFWNLLAFCLAELHLMSVLRRSCYTATVCCAPKLRWRKLNCFAYVNTLIRMLHSRRGLSAYRLIPHGQV